jgi:hypothetical protein
MVVIVELSAGFAMQPFFVQAGIVFSIIGFPNVPVFSEFPIMVAAL